MSSIRCSQFARELALVPVGTAASFDRLALVPAPSPWPSDAKDLQTAQESGRREGVTRVQLITGPEAPESGVSEFSAGEGAFNGYRSSTVDGAIVLVCCHGRRDVCCGSSGTRLAMELECMPDRTFRVWRTSHLGGHRFAPTVLVLPEGTVWAYADAGFINGVVNRSIPLEDALPRYRGCSGFSSAEAQVGDAGALLLEGWDWLDQPRRVTVASRTETNVEVLVQSARRTYTASVGVRRVLPSPTCGDAGVNEATPVQSEYELLSIRPGPC